MTEVDSAVGAPAAEAPSRLPRNHDTLNAMLDELGEHPDRTAEITARIEEVFGEDRAIMALDMSGFSRTTQKRGIVAFLLMIRQMQQLALPAVDSFAGELIKTEGDGLLCLFDTVSDAVQASLEIVRRLDAANVVLPAHSDLYVAIGIGYGHILHLDETDVFGNEINLAHKLGEDIARAGEILLTESAQKHLRDPNLRLVEQHITVSGMDLPYFGIER